ncbi:MAG: tRNA (adenosine(37)-N6)-threonylcarbamoyltransferase complex dimerization subunit type 1 TsaB [Bacillota bacterium]
MLVLAIDASTLVSGVALVSSERVMAEFVLQTAKTHSQRLLPSIDLIMTEAGVKPEQLDGIVVSGGPGSFTGLRIGMSTAKGLAHALGIPIIAVNTLDFWAENYPHFPGLVVPVLDARKGEVYTATYEWGEHGMKRLTPHRATSISTLLDELRASVGNVAFVGDAVSVYEAEITSQLQTRAVLSAPADRLPRPSRLGALGLARLQRGEVDSIFSLVPQYLRQSEAEVKLRQREAQA